MNISKIQTSVNKVYSSIGNPIQSLRTFYKEGAEHPTLAIILERDEIARAAKRQFLSGNDGFKAHLKSRANYAKLKEMSETMVEKISFWEKFRTLYPKSANARLLLLNFGRVDLFHVEPKADENLRDAIRKSYKHLGS